MTLKSIIDTKKKKQIREALKKGDPSMLKKKPLAEEPAVAKPTSRNQLSPGKQKKLNQELLDAAEIGDTQKIIDLLQRGADANAKNEERETPLMLISFLGHTQTAELLIQHGADVNARNIRSSTPLIYASNKGNTQTAELLIQHGADVNARISVCGWSSLHLALRSGYTQTARLLKKHGAEE